VRASILLASEINRTYNVDRVESDKGHEEAQIQPRELVASHESLLAELLFQHLHAFEELFHGIVVGFLALGEAAAVDAVVDVGVDEFVVQLLKLVVDVGRVQVEIGLLGEVVECAVEHLQNFGALVVDDRFRLLVVQDRGGEWTHLVAAQIVNLANGLGAGDLIRNQHIVAPEGSVAQRIRERLVSRGLVHPSMVRILVVARSGLRPGGVDDRMGDGIFEPLERESGKRTVGPGAGQSDVQVISPGLRRIFLVILRDDVAVLGLLSLEGSGFVSVIDGGGHFSAGVGELVGVEASGGNETGSSR